MKQPSSVLALLGLLVLLVAGCASPPREPAGTTAPGSPAPAPSSPAVQRISEPVAVPAASARNVVLAMTGPRVVTEAKDWGEFQREWRETFAEHAKAAGIAFRFAPASPVPSGEEGTLLLVDVADYRIVGIGARIWFGVMTGNAFIDARVRYVNLRDGKSFGEQRYQTSSSAWGGIFAKVTPQQVDSIASNIFADLKAAK